MKRTIEFMAAAFAALAMLSACEKPGPEVTPEISASPNSVTFMAEGETKNVAVTTNVDDWTYSGQPDWVTVTTDGNSLVLEAAANPDLEERTGKIVLKAKEASFTVDLKQEKGSKHPGYAELALCEAVYNGSMYQMFMPDCEGGNAIMTLTSEDERVSISVEFFTEEFASEEEVILPEGTYAKGDDFLNFKDMNLAGTPMTFMTGNMYVISDEEGDEEFTGGTIVTYTTGDVQEYVYVTDGSFSIALNDDGTYTVKTDFKDAEGNDLKYYYEGEIVFDTEFAIFPSTGEELDPTVISSAVCYYTGDSEAGTSKLSLTLEAESGAMTNIDFYVEQTTFDALSIEGVFEAPEAENTAAAGTLDKGSLFEMEGFSFPMGTYIMFTYGDYFIADGASMLMITKNDSGNYTIIANLQTADDPDGGYIIMAEDIPVEIIDDTAYDEDEEW